MSGCVVRSPRTGASLLHPYGLLAAPIYMVQAPLLHGLLPAPIYMVLTLALNLDSTARFIHNQNQEYQCGEHFYHTSREG